MRVDKPAIHSQQSVEVDSNSQPEPGISDKTEVSQDQINFPKTTYGDELAAFADLSGQMRYRDLMNQFNSKTLAYQNYPPPPNVGPATGAPPATGVPGSSPAGDDLGNAAATGDLKQLQKLIAAGVNINSPNSKTGMTPLMQAAKAGKLDAMKFLLAQNPKPDVDAQDLEGRTAMFHAAENKNSDGLALLKRKADPNIHARFSRYPIMEAAQKGDAKSVKILASGGKLKENSDVNKKDVNERTALMEAARYGNAETVKALLEEHAEISYQDVQGRSALMDAARKGNPASTKLLVDRINKFDVPEIRSMIINAKDGEDRTSLMEAAISGNKDTVAELLKSKDIQVNLQDRYGNSALMDAAVAGNAQSVQMLLDKGALPDLKTNVEEGKGAKTALMKAAENGNSDVIKVLANSKKPKVDLNLQDHEGKTALMYAIAKQDLNSVKALIAAGARLDLAAGGKTAATIAQEIRQNATTPDAQKAADEILQALAAKP